MPPRRFLLVLAAVPLASCAPRGDAPNVVLITVDTLRPDHLGGWGYPRGTSPALDRLAAEGTGFVTTLAPRGQTWPTLASIHTSLYPVDHGLRKNGQQLRDGLTTLAGTLRAEGWDCAASITNAGQARWPDFEMLFREKTQDAGAHAAAVDWLARRGERPFFLWIHYFAPHKPFQPPAPYVEAFDPGYEGAITGSIPELQRITASDAVLPAGDLAHIVARYDGEIRRFDGMLEDLLRAIGDLGLDETTLVVLTSDHGEELYERNRYFHHSASIYDAVLKVPLVFRWPGTVPAGRWVTGITESIDLAPTILGLIGLGARSEFRGTSLAAAVTGEGAVGERTAFAEIEDRVVSVRTGEFRYVHNPSDFDVPLGADDYTAVYPIAREELYVHDRDPSEQVNEAAARPDDAAALRTRVERWQRQHDWEERSRAHRRQGVPEDVQASLEALGYVP